MCRPPLVRSPEATGLISRPISCRLSGTSFLLPTRPTPPPRVQVNEDYHRLNRFAEAMRLFSPRDVHFFLCAPVHLCAPTDNITAVVCTCHAKVMPILKVRYDEPERPDYRLARCYFVLRLGYRSLIAHYALLRNYICCVLIGVFPAYEQVVVPRFAAPLSLERRVRITRRLSASCRHLSQRRRRSRDHQVQSEARSLPFEIWRGIDGGGQC